jgi:hypothetical protein
MTHRAIITTALMLMSGFAYADERLTLTCEGTSAFDSALPGTQHRVGCVGRRILPLIPHDGAPMGASASVGALLVGSRQPKSMKNRAPRRTSI